ncbi:glycoside hydrolase family 3 N-terminal domain-containing protein [Bifidobacterium eulemuris]|uniref:Beta-glucosidase-related glycosidase n=1 Tax=Bifidobacterium eulemuris TaxID=1765219 RepID=A0A261G7X1_9BIFI|nr:glycoside hydrolase family 3 N-terminal domain-containing protein [Bifidobacterium eulemuris]OZG67531.1 beta-glucosidase-related glycosidase [Bifidobacterium eulemuris]QOL31068.1 glycoside hydrolase family 3 C-terminal domain-containing protein [Bifidobacterium eulemuris]
MLGINMADVIGVLASLRTQLIVVGVALVAALLVTFIVNKRTVKNQGVRKLVHSETWIIAAVTMIVAVSMMLFGPLNATLSLLSGGGKLTEETTVRANDLAVDIQREGTVLLQNNDDALPLATGRVNVFGWASANPIYGGSGSGSLNDQYDTTSILESLNNAGIETNTELTQFYTDYRSGRPTMGVYSQDWSLPEPGVSSYSDDMLSNARDFSDTAVIVIARSGGEGADLPHRMGDISQTGPDEESSDGQGEVDRVAGQVGAGQVYHNNSNDYKDFEDDQGYLTLSHNESDMLDLVTENFDNVVLIYNGANTFALDFVNDYPQIKSVLWAPPAGQAGFAALGEILTGAVNPSGHTTDTFVHDFSLAPWYNNIGNFAYDNMDEFGATSYIGTNTPTFVNYVEGVYVGYRYYETAADEGAIDYDAVVQYPFGYGLSYTTFEQEMDEVSYAADGTISFDVTVTNTGDVAGKDAVEAYYNPPYSNGGIEKASANLIAFEKTEELAPGESQTISIEFSDEDMASYDYQNARAYVLESGDYGISIRSDSHTIIEEQTVTVPETVTYSGENTRSSDQAEVTNVFDDAAGDVTYLSRADHFANYDEATAAPSTYSMSEEYKATFINASNYENENDDSDEMPTTGADNGVDLVDLYGKDYDDPMWDDLLDQLTFDDMDELIANTGYKTVAIAAINKPQQSDVDGPAALNNNFTGVGSIGLPASVVVANTFNADLATEYGEIIGDMAHEMNVTGWYAPAMNIHRSAYAGRNFEYFSEDPLLSGVMAANENAAAASKGVYGFIKHFALNDQETNRNSMICTWADEQAIREIYLKPFEMAVKDGEATAVMSSYNYIGTRYAGAHSGLLNTVLRDEWGFRGFVETDYFGGYGYMVADQVIRNGGDAMLATIETTNHVTDHSATSLIAMRNAAHNILYTAVNSWIYEDGQPEVATPTWQYIYYAAVGVLGVLLIAAEVVAIRRFLKRRQATVTVSAE